MRRKSQKSRTAKRILGAALGLATAFATQTAAAQYRLRGDVYAFGTAPSPAGLFVLSGQAKPSSWTDAEAVVWMGTNFTSHQRSSAIGTPSAPVSSTGFQSSPSRYRTRAEAGRRQAPCPLSSNQKMLQPVRFWALSHEYWAHSVPPAWSQKWQLRGGLLPLRFGSSPSRRPSGSLFQLRNETSTFAVSSGPPRRGGGGEFGTQTAIGPAARLSHTA